MSLTVRAGECLIRLTALTPAHCGDAAGSATFDRRVAVDAWEGLPYLPGSALKGVLAGRRGNVADPAGRLNRSRTDIFGAPREDGTKEPAAAKLLIGDGELLAFPLRLADGRRATTIVAGTLYRWSKEGLLPEVDLPRIEFPESIQTTLADRDLPSLPLRLRRTRFGQAASLGRALAEVAADEPLLVAAPQAGAALWRASIEERTLTALGPDRVVRPGSLRRIELLAAGTVFVSWTSNLTGAAVDLGPSSPLQLGAYESLGLGYFDASVVEPERLALGTEATLPDGAERGRPPRSAHQVMVDAYRAVAQLLGAPEAAKARSAVFDLGPRLRRRGLAQALGFCLAKAAAAPIGEEEEERKRLEARAYRWLLAHLFASSGDASFEDLRLRVAAVAGGEEPPPDELESTGRWLRRYAEILLPRDSTR